MKWKPSLGYPKSGDATPVVRAPVATVGEELKAVETAPCLECGHEHDGYENPPDKETNVSLDKMLDEKGAVLTCAKCGAPHGFYRWRGVIRYGLCVR